MDASGMIGSMDEVTMVFDKAEDVWQLKLL